MSRDAATFSATIGVRAKQLKIFRPVPVELWIGGHQKQGARVSFVLVTSSRSRRELQQSDRGVASKSAAIGPQPIYECSHNLYYVKLHIGEMDLSPCDLVIG